MGCLCDENGLKVAQGKHPGSLPGAFSKVKIEEQKKEAM